VTRRSEGLGPKHSCVRTRLFRKRNKEKTKMGRPQWTRHGFTKMGEKMEEERTDCEKAKEGDNIRGT